MKGWRDRGINGGMDGTDRGINGGRDKWRNVWIEGWRWQKIKT